MAIRVLIAGFMHETNTFSGLPTSLDSFRARDLRYGDEVKKVFRGTKTEIAAFLDSADNYEWQAVTPVFANATPSGKVEEEAFRHIADTIIASLRDEGPFDALLLALHGAMACSHVDDGEGALLEEIRAVIGREVPIAVTLDLHANVTDRMAERADIIVVYRTYPHVDQYEIGREATDLVHRTLNGEIKPATTVARGDMLDGADHGRTTRPGPMTEILARAGRLRDEPGVLSASVAAGFPWADIQETGPSAVIVTDGPNPRAPEWADDLIDAIWESRRRSTIDTIDVDTAMARAKAPGTGNGPLVLADFADNPGGGGYGDATGLLRGMIDAGLENAAFATVYDPVTVQTCIDQGLGAHVVAAVGGRIDPRFGEPVPVTGHVVAVTDGKFRLKGPMMAGFPIDMGPTVVLRVGGIDIIITSGRFQVYDLMVFEHARVDPAAKSVIAVKSAHHFRAAYEPIASDVVLVDAGGLTSRNYRDLPYENVRRPVYPLDLD